MDEPQKRAHSGADQPTVTAAGDTIAISFPSFEKPGDRIGRYTLVGKIGEGGMGSVWCAEQTEPVRREVALKLIRGGMESKQILVRLEAERQALALMEHPNIAKLLDAGTTESGRPYFVMELIRGMPITKFCDEQRLTIRQRLELFVQVCQAVQHAHQKAVIHRDLKPSNVLVTFNNDQPLPKVIDFGVAKAMGTRLAEHTLVTEAGAIIGTLEYMSPEQAHMTHADIDTRSDIYSLGVMLYEVLTGNTPLTHEALHSTAFDEILRQIRELDPPKPSTRVSQAGECLPTLSERRRVSTTQLSRVLQGDLDWIVMKTLAKDREQRYASANSLAQDIQRHLHNEPILARAPSTVYRLRKLVTRNKAASVASAMALLALVLGLAISTRLLLQEAKARHRADMAANFLKDMFNSVDPNIAKNNDTTLLLQILDRARERIALEFANDPGVKADLQSTLGRAYYTIGNYDAAEKLQRSALDTRQKLHGDQRAVVSYALDQLATTLYEKQQIKEAVALEREALALAYSAHGSASTNVAQIMNNLAAMLLDSNEVDEAEKLQRDGLALSQRILGKESALYSASLNTLANIRMQQGHPQEAEAMFLECLEIDRKRVGNEGIELGSVLNNLALLFRDQEKTNEAMKYASEALGIRRKVLKKDHPELAASMESLGLLLREVGQMAEAEKLLRESFEVHERIWTNPSPALVDSMNNLASVLGPMGQFDEEERLRRRAVSTWEKINADDWHTFWSKVTLGNFYFLRKKMDLAEPMLEAGYAGIKERQGQLEADEKPVLTHAAALLVKFFESNGNAEKAAKYRQELESYPKDSPPAPRDVPQK